MKRGDYKQILAGALIGTILGVAGRLFLSNQKKVLNQVQSKANDWVEKTKEMGSKVYGRIGLATEPKQETTLRDIALGVFAGLAVGVGTALFLTPKSGKQLRKDALQKYNDMAEKTQQIMGYFNGEKPITPATYTRKTYHKKTDAKPVRTRKDRG